MAFILFAFELDLIVALSLVQFHLIMLTLNEIYLPLNIIMLSSLAKFCVEHDLCNVSTCKYLSKENYEVCILFFSLSFTFYSVFFVVAFRKRLAAEKTASCGAVSYVNVFAAVYVFTFNATRNGGCRCVFSSAANHALRMLTILING